MIVPIPIHPRKLRKRGYIQAAEFAKGLSEGLEIPLNTTLIIRKVLSVSLTEKSRTERYDNVAGVFSLLPYISDLKDVHILLVDDVLTTGATIAEAGNLFCRSWRKIVYCDNRSDLVSVFLGCTASDNRNYSQHKIVLLKLVYTVIRCKGVIFS